MGPVVGWGTRPPIVPIENCYAKDNKSGRRRKKQRVVIFGSTDFRKENKVESRHLNLSSLSRSLSPRPSRSPFSLSHATESLLLSLPREPVLKGKALYS